MSNEKKKILHFIWSANFGGISRLVFDLVQEQHKNATLESEILVGKHAGEYIEKFKAKNINVYNCNLNSGMDFSVAKFKNLKRIISGFDIVHFHTFNSLVALATIQSNKKIVYTEHGNFGFLRNITFTEKINRKLLKYFINHYVNFISFNSYFSKIEAEKIYGLKNVSKKVIYNGVVLQKKQYEKFVKPHYKGFIIGTASRFVEIKRIDKLINAFEKFHVNKNTKLYLVGDGKLKDHLMKLVNKKNLTDYVVFSGYQNDVNNFYNLMDVCVFPSYKESFGLVAIETLALGKPTIVLKDGGGLNEIITNIEPNDVVEDEDGLVNRLNYYYYNLKHEDDSLKNKRITYAQKFDIKNMEYSFNQIYNDVNK